MGAFGSDLAAISWFFDRPYETPVATLNGAHRSFALADAGAFLRAQGRSVEALPAMRAALRMAADEKDWRNVAICASNLSQTELLVGEVAAAVVTAEQAVVHADRSGNEPQMMTNRVTHADSLHAAGRREKAESLFADAERRQQKLQDGYQVLYSYAGYCYSDLLLSKGDHAAVRDRAARTLEWVRPRNWLLDIALDTLNLGRANLGLAIVNAGDGLSAATARDDARIAGAFLDQAVERLSASGNTAHLPRGLLARAAFCRSTGDWDGAARDLDEVLEIAEPGPMRLFLCDMALEHARLALARSAAFAPLNGMLENDNPPKPAVPSAEQIAELKSEAEKQLKIAADTIEKCGYHRRDEELAELQAVLRGEKTFADLPPRV